RFTDHRCLRMVVLISCAGCKQLLNCGVCHDGVITAKRFFQHGRLHCWTRYLSHRLHQLSQFINTSISTFPATFFNERCADMMGYQECTSASGGQSPGRLMKLSIPTLFVTWAM